MRTARSCLGLAAGCLFLLAVWLGSERAWAIKIAKLTLYTEVYPPYQTVVQGQLEGLNVAALRELFRRTGIAVEFKLTTWEKAIDQARRQGDAGVFTMVRTPDREESFHWVGPLSVTRWVLLKKKSRDLVIKDLEAARNLRIGTYAKDAKSEFLELKGFHVDSSVTEDADNLKRLLDGDIDLWATGFVAGMAYAKARGVEAQIAQALVFREDFGYLALNPEVPKGTVLELSRVLDLMKSEGLLDKTLKFKLK